VFFAFVYFFIMYNYFLNFYGGFFMRSVTVGQLLETVSSDDVSFPKLFFKNFSQLWIAVNDKHNSDCEVFSKLNFTPESFEYMVDESDKFTSINLPGPGEFVCARSSFFVPGKYDSMTFSTSDVYAHDEKVVLENENNHSLFVTMICLMCVFNLCDNEKMDKEFSDQLNCFYETTSELTCERLQFTEQEVNSEICRLVNELKVQSSLLFKSVAAIAGEEVSAGLREGMSTYLGN
jgi:hypothetical protein